MSNSLFGCLRAGAIALCCWALLTPDESSAAIITLDAVDSGWYQSNGLHASSNKNYFVGEVSNLRRRNYFVFDLSGVTETIVGAELRAFNPTTGFVSSDGVETYSLFNVSTTASTLMADSAAGAAGVAIYNDLGGGVGFGSRSVSSADNNSFVSTTLNVDAIAELNAASGLWAIGGTITTLVIGGNSEYLFGDTNSPATNDRQLVLITEDVNPVPEPASLMLIGAGLLGLATVSTTRRTWRNLK